VKLLVDMMLSTNIAERLRSGGHDAMQVADYDDAHLMGDPVGLQVIAAPR
jgi:hypothetical protein